MLLPQNNGRCTVSTIKFILPKNIFLASIVLFSNAVGASEPIHIGSATSVVNDVLTPIPAGEKKVQINEVLFFKQQILTKENSTLTVTFRDSSTFSVAPQSVVVLDEFVFNPSENVSEKSVNMLKGSFRYISGFPIKNSTTKIVTPFGTAGIRGSAVQGTINSKTGFTVNVASGVVLFETPDGKTSTVKEGETLSVSDTECMTTSAATLTQFFADTFVKMPSSALTPQQILANAVANNMPVAAQKEVYSAIRGVPVNPKSLQGADPNPQSTKVLGDPQAVMQKFMQDLQAKNKLQVDIATRDIVATAVAINVPTDKITQIAINAVTGAKDDYKVTVGVTVINTLQDVKSDLVNEVARKVQELLSPNQQRELHLLLPTVVLPPVTVEING